MESLTPGLQLNLLKNRLALRTLGCAALARQLKSARLVEKPALLLRWEGALKECRILQLVVELLERKEKERSHRGSASARGMAPRLTGQASLFEVQ
jgi:hypothetical protein